MTAVTVEIGETVAVAEGEVILGGEVVAIEILIVETGEAMIEGAHGTPDRHAVAIHEIEALSGELHGNRILTFPVAEGDHDEMTAGELLLQRLDRRLLCVQLLVPHHVAVNALPRDHAPRLLVRDLEHQRGEATLIEAVVAEAEEEVQTVHPAEDHPPPREPRARAP